MTGRGGPPHGPAQASGHRQKRRHGSRNDTIEGSGAPGSTGIKTLEGEVGVRETRAAAGSAMPSCRGRADDACPGGAPAAPGAIFAVSRGVLPGIERWTPWRRMGESGGRPARRHAFVARMPARSRGPTASTTTDTTERPATITNSPSAPARPCTRLLFRRLCSPHGQSLAQLLYLGLRPGRRSRYRGEPRRDVTKSVRTSRAFEESEGAAKIPTVEYFGVGLHSHRPAAATVPVRRYPRAGGQQSGEARHRVFTCLGRGPERQTPGGVKV